MEPEELSVMANGGLRTSSPRLICQEKQDVRSEESLTLMAPPYRSTRPPRAGSLSPKSSPKSKKNEVGSMPALQMSDYYDGSGMDAVPPVTKKSSNDHSIKIDKIHIRLPHTIPYPGYAIIHHTTLSQQLPPPQHVISSSHYDMDGVLSAPPSLQSSVRNLVSPCEKDPHIVVRQSGQHDRVVQNRLSISDASVGVGSVTGTLDKVRIGSITGSLDKVRVGSLTGSLDKVRVGSITGSMDKVKVGSLTERCRGLDTKESSSCGSLKHLHTGSPTLGSPRASPHRSTSASAHSRKGKRRDKKVAVCTYCFIYLTIMYFSETIMQIS